MKNNSIKKDFTSDVANIDFNSPHFEQQSWSMLLKITEHLQQLTMQQQQIILKLKRELKDLKN